MNFLVTVRTLRIRVHRRIKVAGPAACALAVSVTRLWLRFRFETRFSLFLKEEIKYIAKAKHIFIQMVYH